MDKDTKTEAHSLPAVAGQVEFGVRPFAQLLERIGSPPDTHCWDDDSASDCWSYSPQMVTELLDAETERLRAALRLLAHAVPNCVATYRTNDARKAMTAAIEDAHRVLGA